LSVFGGHFRSISFRGITASWTSITQAPNRSKSILAKLAKSEGLAMGALALGGETDLAGLKRKQKEPIAALLTQRTVEDADRASGVGTRTLLRWVETPE
jgi:hypothetical protein